jgi:predicted ATPase
VLFLDDIHWADDGSLAFLDHLMEVNADVPMFIVALARPSLFESEGPRALAWFGRSLRLELASLGDLASRDLVAELLKKLGEVPPLLQELLVARAEGNPFYMEELIRMLIDSGAICVEADRWTLVSKTLLRLDVPRTLAGVLQARLDTLPPGERRALQVASVLGVTFSDKALASIDEAAYAALPALSKRHLVTLRDATPEPSGAENIGEAREYAFTHHFLQQVTYETVLKGRRREAHAGAARWFARQTGARANDLLGIAAAHFEQAGEAGSACEYFARAAEVAAGAFAHSRSNHTQRASLGLWTTWPCGGASSSTESTLSCRSLTATSTSSRWPTWPNGSMTTNLAPGRLPSLQPGLAYRGLCDHRTGSSTGDRLGRDDGCGPTGHAGAGPLGRGTG